ncbi:MAG: hypothetical protein J0H61_01335, partial [Alphaproteobacteria bacterium]|nr:hypothetical protein [Alphaproteobacteria bacterium]
MALLSGPRLASAKGEASHLVVLLHGYGADGDDLIGLAPHWQDFVPGAAFVAPNAPERVPGAPSGFQWFPISRIDPHEMRKGIALAAPRIEQFLDAELAELGDHVGDCPASDISEQARRPGEARWFCVTWWYLEDLARFRSERGKLAELQQRAGWCTLLGMKTDSEMRIVFDVDIHVGNTVYESSLQFPAHFPFTPPLVFPRNEKDRWSGHQYGAGGELCLEYGPDTWTPDLTAVDVL